MVGDVATAELFPDPGLQRQALRDDGDGDALEEVFTASKDFRSSASRSPRSAAAPTVSERMPTDSGGGELVVSPPAGKQTKEEAARTLGLMLAARSTPSPSRRGSLAETASIRRWRPRSW
ncbi:MAG: hypothetical protein U1F43_12495 [Myxococcota bacterium]